MVVLNLHPLLYHGPLRIVHMVVTRAVQKQQVGQLEDEVGRLPLLHEKRPYRDPSKALPVCTPSSCLPGPRPRCPTPGSATAILQPPAAETSLEATTIAGNALVCGGRIVGRVGRKSKITGTGIQAGKKGFRVEERLEAFRIKVGGL